MLNTSDSIGFIKIRSEINCLQAASLFPPFLRKTPVVYVTQVSYRLIKSAICTFRRMSAGSKVRLELNPLKLCSWFVDETTG